MPWLVAGLAAPQAVAPAGHQRVQHAQTGRTCRPRRILPVVPGTSVQGLPHRLPLLATLILLTGVRTSGTHALPRVFMDDGTQFGTAVQEAVLCTAIDHWQMSSTRMAAYKIS